MSLGEQPASDPVVETNDEPAPARRNLIAALLGVAGLGVAALAAQTPSPKLSPLPDPTPPSPPDRQGDTGTSVAWVTWIGTTPSLMVNINLRGMSGASGPRLVVAFGFWAEADGGGGIFEWDGGSSGVDDGGTVIGYNVNAGDSAPNGCWRRVYSEPLNVKWFGAKGDGSVDDKPAIQRAIHAVATAYTREVRLPAGYYRLDSTLDLMSDISGLTYIGIVLRGDGARATNLHYTGTAVALDTKWLAHFCLSDFAVTTSSTTRTGIGILLSSGTITGSVTHVGQIERVYVDGFDVGIQAGVWGTYAAASEMHYNQITLANCNTGWTAQAYNSIDHIFTSCNAGACGYGFYVDACWAIHFRGGSVGHNTISDFFVVKRGGAVSIDGVDSEGSAKFLVTLGGSVFTYISITACEVRDPSNADDVTIDNTGACDLLLDGNTFGAWNTSKVQRIIGTAGEAGNTLVMRGNYIHAPEAFFVVPHSDGKPYANMQFDVSLNKGQAPGAANWYFDDESGYYEYYAGKIVVQRQTRSRNWPFFGERNIQTHIAVGGISATDVPAANLSGGKTITGNALTAAVTFATAEVDDAYFLTLTVTDETPATTAAGARRAYVTSKAATGFTINLEAAPGAGNTVEVDWHLIR